MKEARRKTTVRDLPSARRSDRIPHHRTRLLEEALDSVLSPGMRDGVLIAAGWDRDADAPEGNSSLVEWLTGSLLPCVARVTADDGMAQIREQLGLLLGASGDLPPAHLSDGARSEDAGVKSSGVQAAPRERRQPMMTHAPQKSGAKTLVLWTQDPKTGAELYTALARSAELVTIDDAEELRSTLRLLGDRPLLVLLDRRGGDDEELLALDAADFAGREVLVWGPRTLDTPSLQRLLCEASRAVGCTGEASPADVVDLCVSVLGIERGE